MAPYETIYGRRYRSLIGWFEVGEAGLIGIDLVHQAMEKVKVIQERLKTAQSRQKSYTDVRKRELEFEVDDWVYLKVSPMKGVMRFGKKGKLSPRYIGPYRISKRIGNVAYELELPLQLTAVHPVFHISMLKKCIGDPSLIIPTERIEIKDSLSYEEIPVQILDIQVRKLRTKEACSLGVRLMSIYDNGVTVQNGLESSLVAEVKEKQDNDPILLQLKGLVHQQRVEVFSQGGDGVLRYQSRLCVPRLTKSSHFLAIETTDSAEDCARLYINEIVRLHGVLLSIILDRGPQFASHFWKSFQKGLGTQGSWDDHLSLIEFAYNKSYHSSIQMAPYEALYGRRCRSPVGWFEVGEAVFIGPDLVHYAMEKVQLIRDRLKTAQSRKKSYANVKRME
ncbi:hypothetical protein MTR67_035734 [Solanum verrucosum]|uniref:Tf2-1-like SH3-like domain-containing protein n=1 Tax=Solanum verrucosum TaxID=315347 RepID=A0AAF0ZMK6_SOLVR|nr:hypothetical protein MTR67_035734 [Solanum verrucosum]